MRCTKRLNRSRRGFTLVELLTVVAIIGILVGITFPAVQSVRAAARRVSCANKLKQIGLALTDYRIQNRRFPVGAEYRTAHSWASKVLPFLERSSLHASIDFDALWNDEVNSEAWRSRLSDFTCPSSWKNWEGATDYCGISGSWMGGARNGSRNGVLFVGRRGRGIQVPDIKDGLASTIMVAEGAAVTEANNGYWANGMHCFSHDDGGVNNRLGGFKEIASLHGTGAQAVFCDGAVHFLSFSIDPDAIGAMCTRSRGEVISYEF